MYWYFGTEQGSAIRATGCNPAMSKAQGINNDNMELIALCLSNGLVALSGGLLSQFQGFADVNMGRVFQDPMTGTTATMQIEENLALAARRGKKRGIGWGITAEEKKEYKELLKMLDLGLEDRMTSKVGLLSGGQRQQQRY